MRTDGRTGMTKLVVVFHNFANAPRNVTQNRGRSLKVQTSKCSEIKLNKIAQSLVFAYLMIIFSGSS
jgi:hypothetical protein